VRVDVQGHLNLAVPESLRNHVDRLPCLQQQRRASVAQAVELDLPNTRRSNELCVFPLTEVV
jgi:hypothetical protein